jgi:tRNA A37 threonylcarbamoyladenosine synthetase subunit TsaC/SUA5/YrdC
MDGLGDWADDVPGYAISLARDFWPGPMTLVVKRSALAGDFVPVDKTQLAFEFRIILLYWDY